MWSVFPVQKISHDVCLSVWHELSRLPQQYYTCASAGFFLYLCLHYSVCSVCLSLYVLRLNTRAYGCKDEVNREPEILTALKVSAEGKGHYYYRRRGKVEWMRSFKYSMLERMCVCACVCVHFFVYWHLELSWKPHHPCLQSAPLCPFSI